MVEFENAGLSLVRDRSDKRIPRRKPIIEGAESTTQYAPEKQRGVCREKRQTIGAGIYRCEVRAFVCCMQPAQSGRCFVSHLLFR